VGGVIGCPGGAAVLPRNAGKANSIAKKILCRQIRLGKPKERAIGNPWLDGIPNEPMMRGALGILKQPEIEIEPYLL